MLPVPFGLLRIPPSQPVPSGLDRASGTTAMVSGGYWAACTVPSWLVNLAHSFAVGVPKAVVQTVTAAIGSITLESAMTALETENEDVAAVFETAVIVIGGGLIGWRAGQLLHAALDSKSGSGQDGKSGCGSIVARAAGTAMTLTPVLGPLVVSFYLLEVGRDQQGSMSVLGTTVRVYGAGFLRDLVNEFVRAPWELAHLRDGKVMAPADVVRGRGPRAMLVSLVPNSGFAALDRLALRPALIAATATSRFPVAGGLMASSITSGLYALGNELSAGASAGVDGKAGSVKSRCAKPHKAGFSHLAEETSMRGALALPQRAAFALAQGARTTGEYVVYLALGCVFAAGSEVRGPTVDRGRLVERERKEQDSGEREDSSQPFVTVFHMPPPRSLNQEVPGVSSSLDAESPGLA